MYHKIKTQINKNMGKTKIEIGIESAIQTIIDDGWEKKEDNVFTKDEYIMNIQPNKEVGMSVYKGDKFIASFCNEFFDDDLFDELIGNIDIPL